MSEARTLKTYMAEVQTMTKYSDYRSNGPMVLEHHPDLRLAYDNLIRCYDSHFDLVKAMCGTNGPNETTLA